MAMTTSEPSVREEWRRLTEVEELCRQRQNAPVSRASTATATSGCTTTALAVDDMHGQVRKVINT